MKDVSFASNTFLILLELWKTKILKSGRNSAKNFLDSFHTESRHNTAKAGREPLQAPRSWKKKRVEIWLPFFWYKYDIENGRNAAKQRKWKEKKKNKLITSNIR